MLACVPDRILLAVRRCHARAVAEAVVLLVVDPAGTAAWFHQCHPLARRASSTSRLTVAIRARAPAFGGIAKRLALPAGSGTVARRKHLSRTQDGASTRFPTWMDNSTAAPPGCRRVRTRSLVATCGQIMCYCTRNARTATAPGCDRQTWRSRRVATASRTLTDVCSATSSFGPESVQGDGGNAMEMKNPRSLAFVHQANIAARRTKGQPSHRTRGPSEKQRRPHALRAAGARR